MKLSIFTIFALSAHSALAFAPALSSSSSTSTALHLFGGGGKKEGGDKGGDKGGAGGMMNQLAMFKKAQEVAQKKKKLDEELAAMPFEVEVADGKVKAKFQYVPVMNPMDPNPDYEAIGFEFDEEYFASASGEELSLACKDAVIAGIEKVNAAVTEKYEALSKDLMEALGGGAAPATE